MLVRDVMTPNPTCCSKDTPLPEVAKLMLTHDCGCIPVTDGDNAEHIVGVVTDRDIAVRGVATGRETTEMQASDCMSHPVATVSHTSSLEDCVKLMEENQIRRAVVTDDQGKVCGVVSQADVALRASQGQTAGLVQEISKPEVTAQKGKGSLF